MKTTEEVMGLVRVQAQERFAAQERLEEELTTLAAHLNAATCRWLELVWAYREEGGAAGDDGARWLAFRCGISTREARECLRVAEALRELPALRAAFSKGELTFSKVRSLTRVATAASEETLLELAGALTASQLERALRAFRRLRAEEARAAHELEYLAYHWAEDGSLYLRARLAAEDGTLLVRALEGARERVYERRRAEQAASRAGTGAEQAAGGPERDAEQAAGGPEQDGMLASPAAPAIHALPGEIAGGPERDAERDAAQAARAFEPARSAQVEALVELAQAALAASGERSSARARPERARLVVHVDAAALTRDGAGRSELEQGPVISPETARRLGCDAERVTVVEREGLPLSLGRTRRTVPPRLRRLLEARDDGTCRFPGCERRRHLDAHHRLHWARGGETSLRNLVLLCFHHHRLVHEGGYAIEEDPAGGLRFRNRHGVLCPGLSRPPPGSARALVAENAGLGLAIDAKTNRNGTGDPLDLALAVAAVEHALAR